MPFKLEVEFSGLCLYVLDGNRIGVAMPDARQQDPDDPNVIPGGLVHDDETPAKAHVGYLRYNLGNLHGFSSGTGFPSGETRDHPTFEVIHLFDFEELDFGLDDDDGPLPRKLAVPDVGGFAPPVGTVPRLFSTEPPRELLMRTVLKGGSIDSAPADETWGFSRLFLPAEADPYGGQFAGFSTWTRIVNADELVLRLKNWDGTEKVALTLRPTVTSRDEVGVIKLKIANLCSENPMEWAELGLRQFGGPTDDDFKWFYRLLKHPTKTFRELTFDVGESLPAPVLAKDSLRSFGGTPNCTSLMITASHD